MKTIAVIDAETDPFGKDKMPKEQKGIPEPFLWGFYDGTRYEEFTNEIDLINFLHDQDLIVYAHNGGKFDYHFLLDFIDLFTSISVINGRIVKFKIGKCEFRDSYNILPTSLSAYQKTDIDYDIFQKGEREKSHNIKKIKAYLYNDCKYLYEYVTKFIDRFGLRLTTAGAAMAQWEEISGKKPPRDENGELYEALSKYYYGGRCQCFEHGIINDEFTMVDINSAYPYAMLHPHPYNINCLYFLGNQFEEFDRDTQNAGFLTIDCIAKGSLPYRAKDKSLFFPDDNKRRRYHITGWEYWAAIETNTILDIEIIDGYVFYELQNFSEYINYFYEERKKAKREGDKANDIFCKLMMNALY